MAVLGLRFCARAFSSCGERGPLFIAVRGPLTVAASLAAEQRLQTRRRSSCGSRAQLLRGRWDLPRPGLEPISPALAGGCSTTVPPGKPCLCFDLYKFMVNSSYFSFFSFLYFQLRALKTVLKHEKDEMAGGLQSSFSNKVVTASLELTMAVCPPNWPV